MKMMEDLKELLETELKKIAKQDEMTPQSLEGAYKIVDILKDLETIKAMKEAYPEQGQYSQRGMSNEMSHNMSNGMSRNSYDGRSYGPIWNQDMMPEHSMRSYNSYQGSYDNSYRGSYDGRAGRDADSDGRYSEEGSYNSYDNSYARGRDARGRFTSRDGSYESRYSRHSEKERMIDKLETMADVATDNKTKRAIEQCIDKLEG